MDVVSASPRKVDFDSAGIFRLEADVLRIVDGEGQGLQCAGGRRPFEGAIGILEEGAIFETEIIGADERLGPFDDAIDEGQAFGIPSDILAFEVAVPDDDVVAVPESVFGV